MNKKIVLFIIIFVISLFAFSYTFAANNVVNDVRNVVGGAENAVEDAGKGIVNGVKEPADGKLFYQGYDVKKLVGEGIKKKFAFEETTYLLLFGKLPTAEQLEVFIEVVASLQELAGQFVRDVIMNSDSRFSLLQNFH